MNMQQRLCAFSAAFFVLTLALLPVTAVCAQSSDGGGRRGGFGFDSASQAQITALGDTPVAALPIPVLLGVEVSDLTKNFGDSRSGGRLHEGLDIMAPAGTPIASPTDAVVMSAGNGASSGLYVRTVNPGGESFVYMHLSAHAINIKRGDVLKRGDILGFVGNTGNASGGAPHLHFEIRKGSASDPYPRLTLVFTLAERMQGVEQALEKGDATLAATLASHFRSTFNTATAQGIRVPQSILTLLASGVGVTPPTPVVPALGYGAVVFGESNLDIINLQKFLIAANSGTASVRLAQAGATGYFGPITEAALIEYQRAEGLNPGIVDAATAAYIALSHEGDSSETEVDQSAGGTASFSRDFDIGMTGEDVRALQVFLNSKGFLVSVSGAGSLGQETTYFGALTRAALARYQANMGITPAVGYFGPITRASVAL